MSCKPIESMLSTRLSSAALRVLALIAVSAGIGCGGGATSSSGSSGTTTIPPLTSILTLSASSLTFPSTISGLSSPAQSITVTNSGAAAVTISAITSAGDFSQQSYGCLASLAPAATCQVYILFNPAATGARTGTLTIASTATGSPQMIALSGTATAAIPILSLSASAVSFGSVNTGLRSPAYLIVATNLGSAPLTLSNITSSSGDFTLTSPGCTGNLASRANCQIFVTFSPTAAGTRTGTLTVTNNTPAGTQTVSLNGTGTSAVSLAGPSFSLAVQAGTKPIAAASVQIYVPGMGGNGSTPSALLPLPLASNAAGTAAIPAGYTCPSANSLIYAVASGGIVAGVSAANPNIVLTTALGTCAAIATGSRFVIDEATTVAAAEALQQFYAPGGAIGASATNETGLLNAFNTASTLADPVAGTSPGVSLPANAVSPAPRINSLANILNACVVSSSACPALYTTTSQGTTLPANTLDAMALLARKPGQNVAALYTQSLASTAYSPVLPSAPGDWTVFIPYSGGGLNSPSGIAVDSKGNAWVSSYFGSASEFTPNGAAVFPGGITGAGLNNSYGLAIDPGDNIWIPNEQPFTPVGIGTVSELSPSGMSLAGNGYLNGGLNYPISVAIDPNGTVWVVDYGNSHVTLLGPNGTPLSGTAGYTTPLFAFPVAVAVDANHFGWVVNQSSNFITRVSPDGMSFTNYDCCNLASGIALDQQDNLWVANYFGDTVSLVTNAGTVISGSYTGLGSIYHPQGMAVDGAGSMWVANYRAPYLTELAGATTASPGAALSPAGGLGRDAALLEAYALAIDAAGNIWVSNQGNNTVTKFIGLAVPVKTPLLGLPQLP